MSRFRSTSGDRKTAELNVSALSISAALSVLSQCAWGTDAPPAAEVQWAYALIAALGYLPAPIEIAAATLRRTGMSAEAYVRKNAMYLDPEGAEGEILGVVFGDALESLGEDARGVVHALAALPAAGAPIEVVAAAAGRPAPSTARPLQLLVHGRLVWFEQGSQTYGLTAPMREVARRDVAGDAGRWDALLRGAAGAMQALLFWTAAVEGRPEAAMRRRVAGDLLSALDTAPFRDGGRGGEVLARVLVDACTVLDLGLPAEVQHRLLDDAARLAGDALPDLRARALAALEGTRRAELASKRRGTFATLRATATSCARPCARARSARRRGARRCPRTIASAARRSSSRAAACACGRARSRPPRRTTATRSPRSRRPARRGARRPRSCSAATCGDGRGISRPPRATTSERCRSSGQRPTGRERRWGCSRAATSGSTRGTRRGRRAITAARSCCSGPAATGSARPTC
ncbi:hypothetical protein AB3662_30370 [Sorangium cellulosum]|uniref:hypothetical protein n=1 Tax=Sorangium cellulosum TaxID=56 RepID=UPI003D9A59EC